MLHSLFRNGTSKANSNPIPTNIYDVYIGENAECPWRYWNGMIDEVRVYNRALDADEILTIMYGGRQAENRQPFDKQENVPYRWTLNWVAVSTAVYHDVYFGTDRDAVANATTDSPEYKICQSDTVYVPTMAKNTQYFWRVDEVPYSPPPPPPPMSGDSAEAASAAGIITGKVWSFTTGQSAGTIMREVWTGISGNYVSNLTSHTLYPDSPNIREEITSFEGPIDWSNNYGTRIHGFLTPTATGDYTFWIAGNDESQLWLSTDDDPANAVMIAQVPGWTNPREWLKNPQQRSNSIHLTTGETYYIRALHKQGPGGDNIAVAWEGPGIVAQVIPGLYLSPFDTEAPTPNPMMWAIPPHPTSSTSVSMTAATALDRGGVEYYFACTPGGGHNSGWQESATYEDTGLEPDTVYTYIVTARDASPNHNTTAPSQVYSARTFLAGDLEPDNDVDFADYARFALHWPGAALGSEADLDGDGDVDLRDLSILVENWLGTVEQPLQLPGRADNPNPSNGATGVDITTKLSWTAGSNAESHDVYFGTSSPLVFQGNQTAAIFDPGEMKYLRTYYWRIDEVNASGTTTGTLWSFTTRTGPGPGGAPP